MGIGVSRGGSPAAEEESSEVKELSREGVGEGLGNSRFDDGNVKWSLGDLPIVVCNAFLE